MFYLHFVEMFASLKSFLISLKASRGFGRAFRLRKRGEPREALMVAKQSLGLLRYSFVRRQNPGTGAVLVNLTVLVEHLANELKEPGASMEDLADSVQFLKEIESVPSSQLKELMAWLPYLEFKASGESGG